MSDLKTELASLRIDRESKPRTGWRWLALIGLLAQLSVEEGSFVREGDVIARLESADYQAQVEVARAQVQRSEADLAEQQRQMRITQNLTQSHVVSQDQLDAALSRVRLAEAA